MGEEGKGVVIVCEAGGEELKNLDMGKILLGAFILLFSGCVILADLPKLAERPELSLVEGKGDFIEFFDGKIIEGSIKESGNKGLTIGDKRYHVKDIKSYQYKNEYRTTVKNRFITRVVKGRINVYRKSVSYPGDMFGSTPSSRAGSSATFYYLQKGEDGKILDFEIKTLAEMVKDNPKAAGWVEKYKGPIKKKPHYVLDSAIAVYNLY
jgi:hypothetical protein